MKESSDSEETKFHRSSLPKQAKRRQSSSSFINLFLDEPSPLLKLESEIQGVRTEPRSHEDTLNSQKLKYTQKRFDLVFVD